MFKKGHIVSEETRRKISKTKIGIARPDLQNEKNGNWKGDKVGYFALHKWIQRKLGKPQKCENPSCFYPRPYKDRHEHGKLMFSSKKYEWANVSGEYKRDFSDWIRLCVSCHVAYDKEKGERNPI